METSAAAPFAVATNTIASDANATEQHMVTATGNMAMSEIGRREQESSFQGTTKASTAVIADAVSFGMTSAQPLSPGNIATAVASASFTATDAQLLPIFPVMPAFVVSLMTGVNQ